MLPFRSAQIRTEIEEVVLKASQDIANNDILDVRQGNADNRVRFVDAAVGCHAYVEFGQPRPVTVRPSSPERV
jgi:hypothetical protein